MARQPEGLPRSSGPPGTKVRGIPFEPRAAGPDGAPAPLADVREAMVDHIVVAVGIEMAIVFTVGVVLGIIIMIAAAIRREDRWYTLTSEPPDVAARGVRRLIRVGLRDIIVPDDEREQP